MRQIRSFDGLGVSRGDFLPMFILVLNAFTWFNMTFLMIDKFLKTFSFTSTEAFIIWVLYPVSIIGSSILGSVWPRTKNLSFFYLWMILGTVSSLLPVLFSVSPYVWSFALGFSFGFGMPACLAYFANSSTVENRGRLSGITFLAFYLSAATLTIAFSLLDLTTSITILAIWRGAGLLSFILRKPKFIAAEKEKPVSFLEILKNKTLLLYLLPWIMFIFIDRFENPIFVSYSRDPAISSVFIMGPIIGSLSAFIGGILSDRVGRKKVVVSGFVALGIAYAAIGIAPVAPDAPDALIYWYFYTAVDGIAWGILMVTFLLTIWGDLSQFGGREKYYVIGAAPFHLTRAMEPLLTSYATQIPANAAFSLASLFLFIAVLPLLYAPETLPEKKIELRRLKGYIEEAKKTREKHASKISVES